MRSLWNWIHGLLIVSGAMGVMLPVTAQSIVPAADGTGTLVTPQGQQFDISGGQRSSDGANLFHSFSRFGLDQTQVANFLSQPGVINILSRVTGGDPSLINGLIQVSGGNSNLFLMNPAGIIFGTQASLNVPGSFLATTATGIGIGSGWFDAYQSNPYSVLNGTPDRFRFGNAQPGALINTGNLSVGVGQALTLLAGSLLNTGSLNAPGGPITLASVPGQSIVRLSQAGNLLSLDLTIEPLDSSPLPPTVLPQLLTGGVAQSATGLAVNPDGTIQLTGAAVTLINGNTIVSGTISTSDPTQPGTIHILGNQVGLIGATVQANGDHQGGTILIGGDYQGKGTDPNAVNTFVSRDSVIRADSLLTGTGGKVIVWADHSTRFFGQASARGGVGGQGGLIEISGKENLLFRGQADTSAPNGKRGTLLLDPRNITISSDFPGSADSDLNSGGGFLFESDLPDQDITLSEFELETLLQTNDVYLEATDNITIGTLADGILESTFGSITFWADSDSNGVGAFTMNRGDLISTLGSDVTIVADSIQAGRIDTSVSNSFGGNISLFANGDIVTGELNSSSGDAIGGSVYLNSSAGTILTGDINTFSTFDRGGDVTLLAGQAVITDNINTAGQWQGGSVYIQAGSLIDTYRISTYSTFSSAGNVTLTTPGDIQVQYIDAEAGAFGGTVNVSTNSFFRVWDGFFDQNGVLASISTAGGFNGGAITLQHGGRAIPFRIGDASINGTRWSITDGTTLLEPPKNLFSSYIEGQIQILGGTETVLDQTTTLTQINGINSLSQPTLATDFQLNFSPPATLETELKDMESQLNQEFTDFFGRGLRSKDLSLEEKQQILRQIHQTTGIKPALVYVSFLSQGRLLQSDPADNILQLVVITETGTPVSKAIPGVTRQKLIETAQKFRSEVSNASSNRYLTTAQLLYRWLITPIEAELQSQKIDNLVFIAASGLRTIPLAALHDGSQFLVEKYSLGITPSFGLTDTRASNLKQAQVLAMGASEFQDKNPLPAVPTELSRITEQLQQGEQFLNQAFTLENLRLQHQQRAPEIIHLATHGEFRAGAPQNSYIQLWNSRLQLDQMPQLNFSNPPVELLVLSACRTAAGDKQAELGFAGLAVQSGVKAALASFWYVSDIGTLGLMTEFYRQLKTAPVKAEALRQAQIALIKSKIQLEQGKLQSPGGTIALPTKLQSQKNQNFSHPYYWAAFTMIGNPW